MHTVLVYHSISSPDTPLEGNIDISPQRFEQQLRCLSTWRKVSPLTRTLTNDRGRGVAITFDDGYRDNLTVALPRLEKYSLPMTLFVAAGFIGRDGYLSEDDLWLLSNHRLITIGAHGLWHRHFNRLSEPEARHELIESRRLLSDITGKTIDLMAWPYGECTPELERLAASCGYRAAWSVWKGTNGIYSRWRVPLGRNDNLLSFVAKSSGVYALSKAKLRRFRNRREQRESSSAAHGPYDRQSQVGSTANG